MGNSCPCAISLQINEYLSHTCQTSWVEGDRVRYAALRNLTARDECRTGKTIIQESHFSFYARFGTLRLNKALKLCLSANLPNYLASLDNG